MVRGEMWERRTWGETRVSTHKASQKQTAHIASFYQQRTAWVLQEIESEHGHVHHDHECEKEGDADDLPLSKVAALGAIGRAGVRAFLCRAPLHLFWLFLFFSAAKKGWDQLSQLAAERTSPTKPPSADPFPERKRCLAAETRLSHRSAPCQRASACREWKTEPGKIGVGAVERHF